MTERPDCPPQKRTPKVLRWEVDEHGGMTPAPDGTFVLFSEVAHLVDTPAAPACEERLAREQKRRK